MAAMGQTVVERFLRYVQIDTQSNEKSSATPSTEKQKDLGRVLVEELRELGLDAEMDEHGYVYSLVPSNSDKNVPTIAYLAHQDTSPEASGANVKPIVHDYEGGDIVLPGDSSVVIRAEDNPELVKLAGGQVITSDGTTLLGADDKAGVAEIMDIVHYLVKHPEIKHGPIRIVFTVDEEIGRGVDKIDLDKVGAVAAYTFDGSEAGTYEVETFSADLAVVTCIGNNIHPGFATGKMINAIKMAGAFLDRLPKDRLSPETTAGRVGFVHPYVLEGGVDKTTCRVLLRSFETPELREQEKLLREIAAEVEKSFPGGRIEIEVKEQYRNMREQLEHHPEVAEIAREAIVRADLEPVSEPIRGGTDGSRLTAMGLPTPNIFAGGLNFHSVREYAGVETMKKAVEVGVHIARLWEERA
ncbi:MAG: peptidase T [Acidobacteriota bacterium]|nr:MAG: peptidase T [Acidobacteriota bacterium]